MLSKMKIKDEKDDCGIVLQLLGKEIVMFLTCL
jgi:hypothetical protein